MWKYYIDTKPRTFFLLVKTFLGKRENFEEQIPFLLRTLPTHPTSLPRNSDKAVEFKDHLLPIQGLGFSWQLLTSLTSLACVNLCHSRKAIYYAWVCKTCGNLNIILSWGLWRPCPNTNAFSTTRRHIPPKFFKALFGDISWGWY